MSALLLRLRKKVTKTKRRKRRKKREEWRKRMSQMRVFWTGGLNILLP